VISAGGLSADHRGWVHPHYPFFLPVKALSRVFRGRFVAGLKRLHRRRELNCSGPAALLAEPKQFASPLRSVHWQDWVVYAKPAFGGPSQVLRYLGRYTHRVAISNHRIVSFDGERVTFRYRDYAHGGKHRLMTLTAVEFLRRFFLHVLPKGFVRIRHYGFLANRWRRTRLATCREVLGCASPARTTPSQERTSWKCPVCGAHMILVQRFTAAELPCEGHSLILPDQPPTNRTTDLLFARQRTGLFRSRGSRSPALSLRPSLLLSRLKPRAQQITPPRHARPCVVRCHQTSHQSL
jgi:hypothetical protein